MSFPIVFTLFFVCGIIALTSLITVVFFLIRKKRNKKLYIIPMILFVIFTLLACYLAMGYFISKPVNIIETAFISG